MSEMITINTSLPTAEKIVYERFELVAEDNPVLKQKTPKFDFSSGIDTKELTGRLIETLKVNRAFGLAAPQCGLPHRVLVMGAGDNYFAMYNPELVEVSEEKVHLEEGCLSFPFLFLSITRPKSLVVKFQNEVGDYVNLKLDGISARVVLHELDHLNGVTFDMVAKPLALKMAKRGREKKIKSFAKELVGSRRF
jgi:peptide deformylase